MKTTADRTPPYVAREIARMTAAERRSAARADYGRRILEAFPTATERDPAELYRKLRRIEARIHRMAIMACNAPDIDSWCERRIEAASARARALLGDRPVDADGVGAARWFVNTDPRGYALKVFDTDPASQYLNRDMGGYGIIAPEVR